MTDAKELLKGAIDLHLHSGPGLVPRGFDHVEVVRGAIDAGMRALVIKDHHLPSGNICQLLQKYCVKEGENFNVYGGLVLGNPVGGINPSVVEVALGFNTKVVWMPVMSARYGRERMDYLREHCPEYRSGVPKAENEMRFDPPMSITDGTGRLLPQVGEVCRLIAQRGAILATGHISPRETRLLLDEAVKQGVKNIVITHAEYFRDFSMEDMREFAAAGFYVEHIITPVYSGKITYDRLFELVKNTGAGRAVISSDLGQVGRPLPSEGLTVFIREMQERGLSNEEIRQITSLNQRTLLGIAG